MAITAKCPACDNKIKLISKPYMSQRLICTSCEAPLEVVRTNPLVLDWIFDSDYDFDYRGDRLSEKISFKKSLSAY